MPLQPIRRSTTYFGGISPIGDVGPLNALRVKEEYLGCARQTRQVGGRKAITILLMIFFSLFSALLVGIYFGFSLAKWVYNIKDK